MGLTPCVDPDDAAPGLHRKTPRRLDLPLSVVTTDLVTEHGGTDANKRDVARQRGRLDVADLDL